MRRASELAEIKTPDLEAGCDFREQFRGTARQWSRQSAAQTSHRSVENEDHSIGLSWRLLKAQVTKFVFGPQTTKGTDVAIEELSLGYERLDRDDD